MKTKLLDCTIRDGGYINNWNFSDDFVNDRLIYQLVFSLIFSINDDINE